MRQHTSKLSPPNEPKNRSQNIFGPPLFPKSCIRPCHYGHNVNILTWVYLSSDTRNVIFIITSGSYGVTCVDVLQVYDFYEIAILRKLRSTVLVQTPNCNEVFCRATPARTRVNPCPAGTRDQLTPSNDRRVTR